MPPVVRQTGYRGRRWVDRANQSVVVVGAGGHAASVVSTIRSAGWDVEAVFDDDPARVGGDVLGAPIVGCTRLLDGVTSRCGVLAIGDPLARGMLAERLTLRWIAAIHPTAWVDPTAEVGEGTVVFAGAIVQPRTRVGRHCVVNTAASVDHDGALGDFVNVGPGVHLAGNVSVGDRALIGIGACAIPGVRIGRDAEIGAGAVVTCDVPDQVLAVGVPARVVRNRVGGKVESTSRAA